MNRSGASASPSLSLVPPCPVAVGDRVATPAGTAGEVCHVWWVPPGPSPLVPSRHQPGHWTAVVWEDTGVAGPGEMPFDASTLDREEEVTAPHTS